MNPLVAASMPGQMLTLEQVAWVLQKPARTVRQMIQKREIGSNKMNWDLRCMREDVWAYIEKTRRVAMPAAQAIGPVADGLDWGRIERLIAMAARAEVQSLKSNVQSQEAERLVAA